MLGLFCKKKEGAPLLTHPLFYEMGMRKNYIFAPSKSGPVVQRIERKFPKLLIWVRVPAGLLT